MPGPLPRAALPVGVALLLAVAVAPLRGQEGEPPALHDDFEGPRPSWRREVTDATVELRAHDRSDRAAHDGRTSERLQFTAGPGSTLYFSYPLPPVPLARDLKAQVYARANQEGLRLFGRVVLPGDIDPDTGQPSFVTVPGSVYETADRWQRLELADLPAAVDQQVRVLRARTRRPVPLEGAYLERLVVNVYGGPGAAEVFLDDLTVRPVPAAALPPPVAGGGPDAPDPAGPPAAPTPPRIELRRNRLMRDGFPWIPTIISAPGADLETLRRYGFDVLATDLDDDPRTAREAARLGFLLMPRVERAKAGEPSDPETLLAAMRQYPLRDAVAFWDLGEGLGKALDPEARKAELERVRAVVSGLRDGDGDRDGAPLVTGGVVGLLPQYALEPRLDLMGAHVGVWGSTMHPMSYCQFLAQRRDLTALSNPQGLFWTWIPAAAPAVVRSATWGTDVPPAWGYPRVQPEQIRLFTYAALAAGYRALGFRGDAELTRPSGRARLIELALLNAEIDLFESILARGTDPISLLPTFPPNPVVEIHEFNPYLIKPPPQTPELGPHPSIRAAALETRDHRGTLLLVADFAVAGQWQPGQMAVNDLKIRVNAPQSAQAYEVSLGGVTVLERERVPGGIQISLPDFGPTALVLVTTDRALATRLEEAVARIRPLAIDLAIQQGDLQVQWVTEIDAQLAADGHTVEGSGGLLAKARESIKSARSALEREDYPLAWAEARRVGRPLRLVMVSHFLDALSTLTKASQQDENDKDVFLSPVSSPPLLAFNTLPQQYLWTSWIDEGHFGENLLEDGSFEDPDAEAYSAAGWSDQSYPVDGISATIATVEETRGESRRVLRLKAGPSQKGGQDRLPPFQDLPVAAIRTPAVAVGARQLVRISVLLKMPRPLIVSDSLGGEAMQLQITDPIPKWKRAVLYRRVPADTELTVTLGLAASVGEVFFDDLRIDRIESPSSGAEPSRPSPPLPSASAPRPGRRVSTSPGPAPARTIR
jgi:hypothetical protein